MMSFSALRKIGSLGAGGVPGALMEDIEQLFTELTNVQSALQWEECCSLSNLSHDYIKSLKINRVSIE